MLGRSIGNDLRVPKVAFLPLLLKDQTDNGSHEELVDHRTHKEEEVNPKHTIPPQSVTNAKVYDKLALYKT